MVEIIEGDLFESNANIIAHQVNCKGRMGSGVAKQVREKYPNVFQEYVEACNTPNLSELVGRAQIVPIGEYKYIANIFAQVNYGYDNKLYTDYDALKHAIQSIHDIAKQFNFTVAFPYNIGCHRGGGDWRIVEKMILDIFSDYKCQLYRKGE